jgi:CheY-like chemotaxis protein
MPVVTDPPLILPGPHFVPVAPALAGPSVLPLSGITILAVDDSRAAATALRLLAQRAGARLRRADTIEAARAHLRVYRPDILMIDAGLPDGDGLAFLAECHAAPAEKETPVLVAISGDPSKAGAAAAAGAALFWDKPLPSLAAFQFALAGLLPRRAPVVVPQDAAPAGALDPVAVIDDLVHAAELLAAGADLDAPGYVAGFIAGFARIAGDAELARAAEEARAGAAPVAALGNLVAQRLAAAAG